MMQIRPDAPRVILTYGRFDLFHQGHVGFLRQASQLGGELIVGCATDDYAAALGQPCTMDYDARRALLESCRFVSRVIPHSNGDQKRTDIVNYNVCTLAMGMEHAGAMDDVQDIAQVLYLSRETLMPKDHRRLKPIQQIAFG